MQDSNKAAHSAPRRDPWNKGKLTGAKPPLRPKRVWCIRSKLQLERSVNDLAMARYLERSSGSQIDGVLVIAEQVDV